MILQGTRDGVVAAARPVWLVAHRAAKMCLSQSVRCRRPPFAPLASLREPLSVHGSIYRRLAGVIAWAGALWAALNIMYLPGRWGHSVCGPWGCGPSTQVLVACHAAWIVVLLPCLGLIESWQSVKVCRRTGWGLVVTAVGGLAAVVAYQCLVWYPAAPTHLQPLLLRRCLFSIVTLTDVPLLQLLVAGLWLVRRRRQLKPSAAHPSSPAPIQPAVPPSEPAIP